MAKTILFSLFLFFCSILYSQNYSIIISIENFDKNEIYLAEIYLDKTNIVDTAKRKDNNKFIFSLDKTNHKGKYTILIDKNVFSDVIFNYENVELSTIYQFPMDSLEVIHSEENKIFYEYLRLEHQTNRKLELLAPLVFYYPKSEKFYEATCSEFDNAQKALSKFVEKTAEKNSYTFAYLLISNFQKPYINPELSFEKSQEYLKSHFLDKLCFTDTFLIYSDLYANKILEYLSLYGNNKLSQEQLENEFIKAVDEILFRADQNEKIYKTLVSFLVNGFQKYGFERVLLHIADNYLNNKSCEDEERKSELQKRLDSFRKMAIGEIAPPLEIYDINNNFVKLSEIPEKFKVIIFWASWCPHCNELLPELHKLYKNPTVPKFEVLSISIDTDKNDWISALNKHNYEWFNCSELKGWDSKSANDYHIYATPTLFLIDENRTILDKPLSVNQLERKLKQLSMKL
ncbi:MAG: redoxin domain-containing protein [Bacteroidetes bacterium]|nr:redoxin domain-containing protein [Bacteroidota bacterium]MBT6687910.1 redoxin domain-containing protein [Bacteroidota bacterium]MBT7142442.1 redoxin domain-containing protein [Bacteroidota bacterium]MBT7490051.1 redoxin domain-containing protein [Bacteroidota bacterium]